METLKVRKKLYGEDFGLFNERQVRNKPMFDLHIILNRLNATEMILACENLRRPVFDEIQQALEDELCDIEYNAEPYNYSLFRTPYHKIISFKKLSTGSVLNVHKK